MDIHHHLAFGVTVARIVLCSAAVLAGSGCNRDPAGIEKKVQVLAGNDASIAGIISRVRARGGLSSYETKDRGEIKCTPLVNDILANLRDGYQATNTVTTKLLETGTIGRIETGVEETLPAGIVEGRILLSQPALSKTISVCYVYALGYNAQYNYLHSIVCTSCDSPARADRLAEWKSQFKFH